MMKRFLQLHLLTPFGPSNLNRDELGRPKTSAFGGHDRLRVSSQSLKRAWREAFKPEFDGLHGTRTKRLAREFYDVLQESKVPGQTAIEWSQLVGKQFGALKKADSKKPLNELENETVVFIGPDEFEALHQLAKLIAKEQRKPKDEELKLLREKPAAVDISMFGRMLADSPLNNVEASVQVSHAITVHAAAVEDDYFTAVDDLSRTDETGSAHLGELGFGAGLFYTYICIDRQLLVDNLKGDKALAKRAIAALTNTACTIAPSGKQNSFASRSRAVYALAELSDAQPRQLTMAFMKPVTGAEHGIEDVIEESVSRINGTLAGFDAVYGKQEERMYFNVFANEEERGSLAQLVEFTQSGM
jgi:CRISPR system Cascade subunit CasC